MKKTTHLRFASLIADTYRLNGIGKFALCLGSIYPDLGIMNYIRLHTFQKCGKLMYKKYCKLSESKGLLYLFRVGYISHLLGDFYTNPHTNRNYTLLQHIRWEKELDSYMSYICMFNLSDISEYNFFLRFGKINKEYTLCKASIQNDSFYITRELLVFFRVVLNNAPIERYVAYKFNSDIA